MLRLDASYNKLVIAIMNSDLKWLSRIRRHWIKMLYIQYIIVLIESTFGSPHCAILLYFVYSICMCFLCGHLYMLHS